MPLPPGWSALPPIDIKNGFYLFEPPKTRQELIDFRARLEDLAEESLEDPIVPPYNLTLIERQPNFERKTSTSSPGKRTIPDLILDPAFEKLDALQLVLTRPLAVGKGKWSQVWQGTLTSRIAPSVAPAPVVIKIYQESFFPYGPDIHDIFKAGDDWRPGAFTAALEAWAYDQMRSIQGDSVPWSYGVYKVQLPNGETAFGHLMEFIDGIPASSRRATTKALGLGDDDIWNLADTIGMALHQVHSCGLSHMDVVGSNVILLNAKRVGDDARIGVVLVDFGFVLRVDNDESPECEGVSVQTDAAGIGRVLEEMGASEATMESWDATRRSNPPAWRTMFSFLDRYAT